MVCLSISYLAIQIKTQNNWLKSYWPSGGGLDHIYLYILLSEPIIFQRIADCLLS